MDNNMEEGIIRTVEDEAAAVIILQVIKETDDLKAVIKVHSSR